MRRATFLGVLVASAVSACSSEPGSKPIETASKSKGQVLFERNCSSCHGAGIGNPGFDKKPGTAALEAKYRGQMPGLLEERTDLTPELIHYVVRHGASVMAPYRKSEISDEELASIATYLSRNNPDIKGTK